MKIVQNKSIQIFSNGSLVFKCDGFKSSKQCQMYEKDYNNFFLFKKNKKVTHVKSNVLSNYKNNYLF